MANIIFIANSVQKGRLEPLAGGIKYDLRRTLAARKAGEIGCSVRYYLACCESGPARRLLLEAARREGVKIVEVEERQEAGR